MIRIRDFQDTYLPQLQEMDFMMWLMVQWNGTVHREDVFAAVDEQDNLLGVCALSCDGTWYYLESGREDIPLYRLQMELCTGGNVTDRDEVERALVQAAKQCLSERKKEYPDKKLCLRCWCRENEYDKQQRLLDYGFKGYGLTWIMGFDLEHTQIPETTIPDNVSICIMDNTEEDLCAYFAANERGYDNIKDAEAELRFRLGDERTKVFVARDGDQVVSSVTVWHIDEDGAATENVFTVPEYRRRRIGMRTIAESLAYLREQGYKMATLTCVGDNVNAIALYRRMGYRVVGHLLEMHWEL